MSNVKIEINTTNIGALLKSGETESVIKSLADQIANRAGTGYASDTYMTPGRVVASAYTATEEAVKDNSENNTLLIAVEA